MAKAVAVVDEYDNLISGFVDLGKHIAGFNLRTYYFAGKLCLDFFEKSETPKYGGRLVGALADDLKAKNIFPGIKDVQRFLYWGKNTFDFFKDEAELVEWSDKGFTISHAKHLFGQRKELIEAVKDKMVSETGKIVSVMALETIISREARAKSIEVSKVVGEVDLFADPTANEPGVAEMAAPVTPGVAAAAPGSAIKAPDAKEPKKEKEKPAKDKTTPSTPTVANPLKVINGLEKTVSKAVIDLPDALIAIKATSKQGFDSEKAEKNFITAVANLKAALKDSIEPFQALLKEIEECE